MKRLFIGMTVIMLAAVLAWPVAVTAAEKTTRDLVFEEEKPVAAAAEGVSEDQVITAAKVTLELERDGKKQDVLPNYVFKTGDRVRIIYSTNIDCNVYWLAEGTSGAYCILFPNPKFKMDSRTVKNQEYVIPPENLPPFKVKGPPGIEKLTMVMTTSANDELEAAAEVASSMGGCISEETTQEIKEEKRRTRDLVFEEEDQTTGVATVSQAAPPDQHFFQIDIELKHE